MTANSTTRFLLLDGGKIVGKTYKYDLPNYGVFDEKRVFEPGPMPGPFNIRGVRVGVPICEDIWTPDVVECLTETGGEILLVPNGSPFEAGKEDVRLNLVAARVTEAGLPLIYLNQVGGQDELVFDGASLVANADCSIAWALPAWEEQVVVTEWKRERGTWVCVPGERWPGQDREASVYHAMMLGLRDYVNKNRFPGVVLGLSGGIDSALSAAVAVDALGPRTRALRDDAVALYVQGKSRRRGRMRQNAGRALRNHRNRRHGCGLHGNARTRVPRASIPTQRKKTFSRASAASS